MDKKTLREFLAYELTRIPGILEVRWLGSCDGDRGCGGLARVRVDSSSGPGNDHFHKWRAIYDLFPECLDDGSLPHHLVYEPDDEGWEDEEFKGEEVLYRVNKETT